MKLGDVLRNVPELSMFAREALPIALKYSNLRHIVREVFGRDIDVDAVVEPLLLRMCCVEYLLKEKAIRGDSSISEAYDIAVNVCLYRELAEKFEPHLVEMLMQIKDGLHSIDFDYLGKVPRIGIRTVHGVGERLVRYWLDNVDKLGVARIEAFSDDVGVMFIITLAPTQPGKSLISPFQFLQLYPHLFNVEIVFSVGGDDQLIKKAIMHAQSIDMDGRNVRIRMLKDQALTMFRDYVADKLRSVVYRLESDIREIRKLLV